MYIYLYIIALLSCWYRGYFYEKWKMERDGERVIQCVTSHPTAIKAGQSVVCITPQNPYMPC
jgi:hypothetical protein